MPITSIFEDRPLTMAPEEIKAKIELHDSKIKNLKLTLLDFMFDAQMMHDYEAMNAIKLVAPPNELLAKLEEKYGPDPDESQFTDEDIKAMNDAMILNEAFRGSSEIRFSAIADLHQIRHYIEEILPFLDSLSTLADMAQISTPQRCLSPLKRAITINKR